MFGRKHKGRNITNVLAVNAALGESAGWCSILDDKMRVGNTGARMAFVNDSGSTPVKTIDSLGYTAVDFIKLDVEGSELAALKGATETIKRSKPILMVECKKSDHRSVHSDTKEVRELLDNLGYKEAGYIRHDKFFVPVGG